MTYQDHAWGDDYTTRMDVQSVDAGGQLIITPDDYAHRIRTGHVDQGLTVHLDRVSIRRLRLALSGLEKHLTRQDQLRLNEEKKNAKS